MTKKISTLLCFLILLISVTASGKLPHRLARGSQFGVISESPTVNQTAFHWLKQKGTVWDAAIAVMFQLLLDAPHIVSFDSDVSLMVFKRGTKPKFYWLSNFDMADPSLANVYPYSIWSDKLRKLHNGFSKYSLNQLLAPTILRAKSGWTFPEEFLPSLRKILPAFKSTKSKTKIQNNILLHQIERCSHGASIFPILDKNLKTLISRKKNALSSKLKKAFNAKHVFVKPPKIDFVFTNHIDINNLKLFAAEETLLSKIQENLKHLGALKSLSSKSLRKYKKKSQNIHSPFRDTLGVVLFDRYGNLIAINVGIPNIQNGYKDKQTGTFSHREFSGSKYRIWTLSPYTLWHEKKGVSFVITPKIMHLGTFLKTFPISLFKTIKLKQTLVDNLEAIQSPNTIIGLEVWPRFVVGFTPSKSSGRPLLY